jgi:hypothetical protein
VGHFLQPFVYNYKDNFATSGCRYACFGESSGSAHSTARDMLNTHLARIGHSISEVIHFGALAPN